MAPKPRPSGFSLIELVIVVAIVGILATIAYPSYRDYVIKSRRSDAMAMLTQAQLAQEKYRANNTTYGTLANIGVPATTTDSHYTLSEVKEEITDVSDCSATGSPTATSYAIVAVAKTGQDQDIAACRKLCVDETGTLYPTDCIRR